MASRLTFRRVGRTPGDLHTPVAGRRDSGPLLEVRNLKTRVISAQGVVNAVDGVNLTINRSEIVALVGETGSGKTMTALSIMRLLPLQAETIEGTVLLDGVDLLTLSEAVMNHVRGERIGLLFQQPRAALDPTSSIGAQVGEAFQLHRHASGAAAHRRAVALLTDVGIPEPERRSRAFAHQMSGGMAQRAMIAAALSGEPDLLIADEPTTALDVTVQAQILNLLLHTRSSRGLAILLITHDLAVVKAIADRVAVMYAGRIVEEGTTAGILATPRHPYTQALVQSSLLESNAGGRLFALPVLSTPNGNTGCRFCPRCALSESLGIRDHCQKEEPALLKCGNEHAARCWAVTPKAE